MLGLPGSNAPLAGVELYAYDGFNRMTRTTQGGALTELVYRPDGLRHSKTTGGGTTTHVWDGANLVLDATGGDVVKYLRGINLLFMQDGYGDTKYYQFNAHGDVVRLIDTGGGVVRIYDYDAFGVEHDTDEYDTNPWRYCGEYWDAETGTVYLRARYYDPVRGRFTQQDEWSYADPTDPLSLNLYTYCGGDPVNYWDPSGHKPWASMQDNDVSVSGQYKNIISPVQSKLGVYSVTTLVPVGGKIVVYNYVIDRGVIRFDFSENIYWSMLWRDNDALAAAMFDAARSISPDYLSGRTVEGISAELKVHYLSYKASAQAIERLYIADMGGTDKNLPGYDSNAYIFEMLKMIEPLNNPLPVFPGMKSQMTPGSEQSTHGNSPIRRLEWDPIFFSPYV